MRDEAVASIIQAYRNHRQVKRAIRNQRNYTSRLKDNVDTFGVYLNQAGSFALLEKEDEWELFSLLEKGIKAYDSARPFESLTDDEALVFIHAAAAHQVIFNTNLRLVINISKKYAPFVKDQMGPMDIVQEGNLGLLKAISRFDVTRDLKFSTYATLWVRQNITRAIGDQSRIIRLPVHLHEKYLKVRANIAKLQNEFGRDLTEAEIAKAAKMPYEKYEELMRNGAGTIPSLDTPIHGHGSNSSYDEGTPFGTLLEDPRQNMDNVTDIISDHTDIRTYFKTAALSDREKFVLGLRFGIEPELIGTCEVTVNGQTIAYEDAALAMITTKGLTLDIVGDTLGITRERVRQLEQKALKTIRDGNGLRA